MAEGLRILATVVAGMLWIDVETHDRALVLVADAEFIRAWRENRP